MMTQETSSSFTMAKFVLDKYYTFSQAVFSLAKTISSVKRLRREFAPFADCIKQAKSLLYEESMEETDHLISQGCLQGYDIQTRDDYK